MSQSSLFSCTFITVWWYQMIAPHSKNNRLLTPSGIRCFTPAEINVSHFAGTFLTIFFWTREMLSGFIQSYSERHCVENYCRNAQIQLTVPQDSFALLLQPTYLTIAVTEPWYRVATLAFSTSLNTDRFWFPIWLSRANKQHWPKFWLPMDHPISASLSLIDFNKMPALHFPMLNVADPPSVLSFSYLNLTWLNAQCFTERQQSLR